MSRTLVDRHGRTRQVTSSRGSGHVRVGVGVVLRSGEVEEVISHRGWRSRARLRRTHSESVLAVSSVLDERVLVHVRVSSEVRRVAGERKGGERQRADDGTGPGPEWEGETTHS